MYFKVRISKWHVLDLVFQLQNIVQVFPKYPFVLWRKICEKDDGLSSFVIYFFVFLISITITKSTYISTILVIKKNHIDIELKCFYMYTLTNAFKCNTRLR